MRSKTAPSATDLFSTLSSQRHYGDRGGNHGAARSNRASTQTVLRLAQSTRTKDMARTAQEFLTSWRQSYIYAEARPPEALDEAVAECVADGLDEGHTRDALEKAAG